MGIILFVLFGLVVGFIARAVMPGTQKMGLIATAALGIAGSFIGGFLASLFTHQPITDMTTAGILGSVVGALLLLFILGRFFKGRAFA
jgi:uncharacterized membrane protein YeaQ/YmgE (transglycosylase-associated protein family)